jgi:hypothetical protein
MHPEALRRQRRRSVALAFALGTLAIIFYVIAVVRVPTGG